MIEHPQMTVSGPVEIQGEGLHLGKPATCILLPAAEGEGLFFRGPKGEKLTVGLGALEERPLRTALVLGEFSVETVEHLLAAVTGLGITNVEIQLDGPEPPACDGSAMVFAQKILEVGLKEQNAERPIYKVISPLVIDSQGGGHITALPYNGLKITYILSGEGLPHQTFEYEHDQASFLEHIAQARTFCRKFEVEKLKGVPGVGDGAHEGNTLLVDLEDLDEKMRLPNELAAHKILDVIGDLSLFGKDIHAHLICHRSGHAANHELLREIRVQSGEFSIDINTIKEVLPHAYPFLLVDRILDFEEGKRIVGLKNVTMNEPFFPGHFPDEPIMPGVLLIEALAQTGAIFIYRNEDTKKKKLVLFTGVDKVKFRQRVCPGDQVILEIEAKNMRPSMGVVRGVARVDGALACEAELKFMIVERT
jgi:UDP-3-O-[3-hydroxymyristoyl] N-acetylglucosamine deacetylase/3-hydroxyacyl-[acyl-carrier-protein] dehydratase